jgi:HK97 family phage major capsid protein
MTAGAAPATTPSPYANVSFKTILDKMESMRTQLTELTEKTSSARESLPVPHARKGEDPLTSRGYSFLKLFQFLSKKLPAHDAKVEIDMANRLQKFWYEQCGYQKTEPNSVLAPMGSSLFPCSGETELRFVKEVHDCVKAGVFGADPEEIARMARTVNKALSWQDATALGDLVAPPAFGELIDLLRANEVFSQAGCTMMGLPPNGRMVFPRQTGASTAYYVGESVQITESEPTTGDLVLMAKKLACLIKVPNELFRYASVSVEQFLRNDMARVMALRMDKELLEGIGSAVAPKGLINYANIGTHTAGGTPADGNSGYPLLPEDIYKIIAKVEEKNAIFKSWIMRPLMWSYIVNRRADAITAGDGKGQFLFNIWRELAQDMNVTRNNPGVLAGYPVYKSTNISNTRTRGSGTTQNTYILGGDFTDYIIAASPTVEFAMANQTTEAFTQDQTWLRAIHPHDGGPRREASFILCDQLLYS